jgi:hypothetical protein
MKNLVDNSAHATELARLQKLMAEWQTKLNDKVELPTTNKPPPAIDLTGRKRKSDQWQPDWIVEKYFQ